MNSSSVMISRRQALGTLFAASTHRAGSAVAGPPQKASVAAAIQSCASAIETEVTAAANGSWDAWFAATAEARTALNSRLASSFRQPRRSRFRDASFALLTPIGSPSLYAGAADCLHAALYQFESPDQPEEAQSWLASIRVVPVLQQIKNWLASYGVDLIVAPIPRAVDLYPATLIPAERLPKRGVDIAPHIRRLMLDLVRGGVEVLDLYPAFREHVRLGKAMLYLATDPHWSDIAQQMVARMAAARLARYDFVRLAQSKARRYHEKPAKMRFGGYFYEYLTREEAAAMAHSMDQRVRSIVGLDGRPFSVASSAAQVLVLGDSFTNFSYIAIGREQSGEAVALRAAEDPFAEFKLPPGTGVVAYLARELNLPVGNLAILGSTLQTFIELFRDPSRLRGVKVIVWLVNATAFARRESYPANFRTPSAATPTVAG